MSTIHLENKQDFINKLHHFFQNIQMKKETHLFYNLWIYRSEPGKLIFKKKNDNVKDVLRHYLPNVLTNIVLDYTTKTYLVPYHLVISYTITSDVFDCLLFFTVYGTNFCYEMQFSECAMLDSTLCISKFNLLFCFSQKYVSCNTVCKHNTSSMISYSFEPKNNTYYYVNLLSLFNYYMKQHYNITPFTVSEQQEIQYNKSDNQYLYICTYDNEEPDIETIRIKKPKQMKNVLVIAKILTTITNNISGQYISTEYMQNIFTKSYS